MDIKHNRGLIVKQIIMIVVLIFMAAGCSKASPTATSTPVPSETPLPSATSRPTATSTSMPEMPEGPFVWTGETRPLLMAHYMPWYQNIEVSGVWGWHWTMNHFQPKKTVNGWQDLASHFTPLTGPYDSSDEAVLKYQVMLMKLSGIDGVIVDWYGIENFWDYGTINQSTQKLFEIVKRAGLKFVICYEDQTIKNMVDNNYLDKADVISHGQEVMAYLQTTWFKDEAYLQAFGRPVLMTFGPRYYEGEAWDALFDGLDPKPVFITLDNHVVPASTASYLWPPMWASQAGVLSHDVLLSYLDSFYEKAAAWDYLVAGAFPGFYDIYKEAGVGSSYGYLDALDGDTFRFTMQEALNQFPDMIQLITWNDYGEGTMIEPTVEYEYRYLEMVQDARQVTSAGEFTFTPDDLRIPMQWYNLRLQYKDDAEMLTRLDQAFEAIIAGDLATAEAILSE